jgi:radical SAM/Cys-rich protein
LLTSGEQLATLERINGIAKFEEKLKETKSFPLQADKVQILQINVGRRCNLACKHCHVGAGPARTEEMSREVFEKCLKVIKESDSITTVDITGGSPEMNPDLEWFLGEVAKSNKRLIVRSNLVILLDEKFSKFIDVYAKNKVEVVGSLPDYKQEKSDRQRGEGYFYKSIKVIQLLNQKGYGMGGSGLVLDLVYNPVGAYLPGSQQALEHEYRTRLKQEFGIVFNNLFCIANMPIGRFLEYLLKKGNYDDYMQELANAYNPGAVPNVMCRVTVSVGWDGRLYDCDFNQMLGLSVSDPEVSRIGKFDAEKLSNREIVIHNHCYGCTAGSGSSCQGALE